MRILTKISLAIALTACSGAPGESSDRLPMQPLPEPGAGGSPAAPLPDPTAAPDPPPLPDPDPDPDPGGPAQPPPDPPPDPGPGPAPFPAPTPTGCIGDVSPGFHNVACDGITHDVTVPPQCHTEPCGLVLDLHGGTMSGKQEDNNTGLAELGVQHGYVVVQSNALGGMWTAGIDDAKVHAFALQAVAAWHLDEKRIHMTGFSQGGYMTWRFICNHSDWLASAAPGAAGVAEVITGPACGFAGAEMPSRQIPILQLQGTQDALVKLQSGLAQRDNVIRGFGLREFGIVSGDATYRRIRYVNDQGGLFEYLEHDYSTDSAFFGVALVGHCYPGSLDHAPSVPGQLMGYGCKGANSFHWGFEVMQFFLQHPRP